VINCLDFIHFPWQPRGRGNEIYKRFIFVSHLQHIISQLVQFPSRHKVYVSNDIILIFRRKFYSLQTHTHTYRQHTEMSCREISIVLKSVRLISTVVNKYWKADFFIARFSSAKKLLWKFTTFLLWNILLIHGLCFVRSFKSFGCSVKC